MDKRNKDNVAGIVICLFITLTIRYIVINHYAEKGHEEKISQEILAIADNNYPNTDTISILKNRISEMYSLYKKLKSKQKEVKELAEDYYNDVKSMGDEIKNDKSSYSEAIQDPITSQKLNLLQKKYAYMEELNSTYKFLVTGTEELGIKLEEAYADLQMISILGEDEKQKLFFGIDKVINDYREYTGDEIIDKSKLRYRSLQDIWEISTKI